jgi:hypothetical protein
MLILVGFLPSNRRPCSSDRSLGTTRSSPELQGSLLLPLTAYRSLPVSQSLAPYLLTALQLDHQAPPRPPNQTDGHL